MGQSASDLGCRFMNVGEGSLAMSTGRVRVLEFAEILSGGLLPVEIPREVVICLSWTREDTNRN